MSHCDDCRTPGTVFRRSGAVWACYCGQMWRLVWDFGWGGDAYRMWEKFYPNLKPKAKR